MHAPPLRRRAAPAQPAAVTALKWLIIVQIVALVTAVVLVSAPFGRAASGPPSDPVVAPIAATEASPTPLPSVAPAQPPSESPSATVFARSPVVPSTPAATPSPTAFVPAAPQPPDRPAPFEVAPTDPTAPPAPRPARTPAPVAPVAPDPTGRPDGGPPGCDYFDIVTQHAAYGDWDRTLLDTIYRLPSKYAPGDLVDTAAAGLNGGYSLRAFVIPDLAEMAAGAQAVDAPLEIVSGYRSYAKQKATFQRWVEVDGFAKALRTSARAGHSEHQLGTVLDVSSLGDPAPWNLADWASTLAGAWIADNSWQYGFVVSYPRGGFDQTCYDYEPWHLRYVGRERAARIVASGMTPREVFWQLR